jgi:uncharacterized membrane protein
MSGKATITVFRPLEEVEHRWNEWGHRPEHATSVTFKVAPGDHGTEIHVELDEARGRGKLGELVKKAAGSDPVANARDELRRFKQLIETGVIARSDAVPEGELVERKPRQRPAQPVPDSELEKVGV